MWELAKILTAWEWEVATLDTVLICVEFCTLSCVAHGVEKRGLFALERKDGAVERLICSSARGL